MKVDPQISRGTEWVTSWVGNEFMMMCSATGEYLNLSQSGGRIWELLDAPMTLEALCRCVAQEYQLSPREVEEDVSHFVEQMVEIHTLHLGSPD